MKQLITALIFLIAFIVTCYLYYNTSIGPAALIFLITVGYILQIFLL